MRRQLAVFLALLYLTTSLHLSQSHQADAVPPITDDLFEGPVYLIADNGQYLKICSQCGPGLFPWSATIQNSTEQWGLERVGNQVAFKSSTGKYLARCTNCWTQGGLYNYSDSAFVYGNSTSESASLWTVEQQSNGKYAFRGDNGKYLARCTKCAIGGAASEYGFVHGSRPTDAVAQWDVVYTNFPKVGTNSTIQNFDNQYLKYCPNCAVPNAVSLSAGTDANANWIFKRIGNKVAIKGANGNYLSRCDQCWPAVANKDTASLNVQSPGSAESLWTPTKLSNGNWIFKSDSGKYLSKCDQCVKDGPFSIATVHSTNPTVTDDTFAQWKLA